MLDQLTRGLEASDAAAVVATMADDVTLRVAVHDAPFHGVAAVAHILDAVLDGALGDIQVTEKIGHDDVVAVLFTAHVATYAGAADGLLVVRLDANARISDLTVFLRPLVALSALADEMGRRLGGPRPDGDV